MEAAGVFTVADVGGSSAESGSGVDSMSLKCAATECTCWPQVQLFLKDPREVGKMALCLLAAGQVMGTKPIP